MVYILRDRQPLLPNHLCHTPIPSRRGRGGRFDWGSWWDFLLVGRLRGIRGEHVVLVQQNHETNQKPENSCRLLPVYISNTLAHTHTYIHHDFRSYLPLRLQVFAMSRSLSFFHFLSVGDTAADVAINTIFDLLFYFFFFRDYLITTSFRHLS